MLTRYSSNRFPDEHYLITTPEDRCSERAAVTIPASLRQAGGRGFATTVLDLSLAGFSAACPDRMPTGTVCWLTLPSLEALQAEVIWWDSAKVGCAFDRLLSPIVHDNIVQRYRNGMAVTGRQTVRRMSC